MKVLLLDNYDSFTQNLKQILEESGLCDFEIRKNDQISLEEVNQFDKILISPGPGVPREAGLLIQIIEEFAAKKSILGICLGHQAIAEVFGARLINLAAVYHGLEEEVTLLEKDDLLFQRFPQKFSVGLYHSWAVSMFGFPEELDVIAISSQGLIMAIAHEEYPVWGVQFHPESIMTREGKLLVENWLRYK